MRKLPVVIALVSALAVPSAVAVGLSSTAGATTIPGCGKLTGTAATTVTISKCTPAKAGYTSASGKSSSLLNGGSLTWSTSNDSYDFIDKLGGVRGGSVVTAPAETTTYTLNATNQYGRSTRQITVTVH